MAPWAQYLKLQMDVVAITVVESTLDGSVKSQPFNFMRIYWERGHGKSKGDGTGGTLKVQKQMKTNFTIINFWLLQRKT